MEIGQRMDSIQIASDLECEQCGLVACTHKRVAPVTSLRSHPQMFFAQVMAHLSSIH